jgi:hypothetical protein
VQIRARRASNGNRSRGQNVPMRPRTSVSVYSFDHPKSAIGLSGESIRSSIDADDSLGESTLEGEGRIDLTESLHTALAFQVVVRDGGQWNA